MHNSHLLKRTLSFVYFISSCKIINIFHSIYFIFSKCFGLFLCCCCKCYYLLYYICYTINFRFFMGLADFVSFFSSIHQNIYISPNNKDIYQITTFHKQNTYDGRVLLLNIFSNYRVTMYNNCIIGCYIRQ